MDDHQKQLIGTAIFCSKPIKKKAFGLPFLVTAITCTVILAACSAFIFMGYPYVFYLFLGIIVLTLGIVSLAILFSLKNTEYIISEDYIAIAYRKRTVYAPIQNVTGTNEQELRRKNLNVGTAIVFVMGIQIDNRVFMMPGLAALNVSAQDAAIKRGAKLTFSAISNPMEFCATVMKQAAKKREEIEVSPAYARTYKY